MDLWLQFGEGDKSLVRYTDTDGSMAEDRQAITGYSFLLNGSTVSWSSKCQEIIFLSTTESKYIAATSAAKEALWLRMLIVKLFSPISQDAPAFVDLRYSKAIHSPAFGNVTSMCMMEVLLREVCEYSCSHSIYTNLFLSDNHMFMEVRILH